MLKNQSKEESQRRGKKNIRKAEIVGGMRNQNNVQGPKWTVRKQCTL